MTERHCTKCEAYEILIDKLAQKSEERNKDLKTRIKDLEQKLAAQDKVVKTVPILTECCRNLQWQLKDKDKVIQKFKEEEETQKQSKMASIFGGLSKKEKTQHYIPSDMSAISELTDDDYRTKGLTHQALHISNLRLVSARDI